MACMVCMGDGVHGMHGWMVCDEWRAVCTGEWCAVSGMQRACHTSGVHDVQ